MKLINKIETDMRKQKILVSQSEWSHFISFLTEKNTLKNQ